MSYGRPKGQDSISAIVPMLLATAGMSLLAIVWRRRAAPRTVVSRRARPVSPDAVPTPAAANDSDLQTVHAGTGSVFHRRYAIELPGTPHRAADVMRLLEQHFAELAPSILAQFEKTTGAGQSIRVGDEYEISMLGPWNGRVRAVEVSDTAFTLATLDGHPEAGHITFSVTGDRESTTPLRIEIESWARARSTLVATAYDTLGIGKQVQTEAWITFLQRLAALAGVSGTPEVHITDEIEPVRDETELTRAKSTDA